MCTHYESASTEYSRTLTLSVQENTTDTGPPRLTHYFQKLPDFKIIQLDHIAFYFLALYIQCHVPIIKMNHSETNHLHK